MNEVKIIFKHEVWKEIKAYVDEADVEIGGLCKAKIVDKQLVVLSNHMPEQVMQAAHCSLKAESIAKLDYETRDMDGEFWVWWHSHVNMGVSPSGTDVKTRREYAADAGRCASIIINKRGDVGGTYVHMVNTDADVDGLPQFVEASMEIVVELDEKESSFLEKIKASIKSLVIKPKPVMPKAWTPPAPHNRPSSLPSKSPATQMDTFEQMKSDGVLSTHGMSKHDVDEYRDEMNEAFDYWYNVTVASGNSKPSNDDVLDIFLGHMASYSTVYMDAPVDCATDTDDYLDNYNPMDYMEVM